MKGITELDTLAYLKQLNEIRETAAEFLDASRMLEIWKRVPYLTGDETAEERKAAIERQQSRNMNEFLNRILKEHPEETVKLMEALIVYEDGDEHLTGVKLVNAAMREMANRDLMDFFTSCVRSGLIRPAG